MKKKICIITGSRAEYGLLKPLIDELNEEKKFKVQIIATGMHLSPEFGLTYKEIENDGLEIDEKIEILLSSDTTIGVSKAMGLALISFAEAFQRLKPDLIIGLGDRFELFAAVSSALINKIPVAHIHGGELTEGAYDNSLRHAITKMSHLHFTSTEEYRRRVIQLGENPKTVFNVGALGIDNIKKIKLLKINELEEAIGIKINKMFFIVTFHPVTLNHKTSVKYVNELLLALDEFKDYQIIFTKPNADNDSRIIIKLIDEYVARNRERTVSFQSLGRLKYLSMLKYAAAMIGNSSSGIIEMPYFSKPTINIGDRQKGRIFPESIIQCVPDKASIIEAINKGVKSNFKDNKFINVYGNGSAGRKIKKILLETNYSNLIKKEFYDIRFNLR